MGTAVNQSAVFNSDTIQSVNAINLDFGLQIATCESLVSQFAAAGFFRPAKIKWASLVNQRRPNTDRVQLARKCRKFGRKAAPGQLSALTSGSFGIPLTRSRHLAPPNISSERAGARCPGYSHVR